MYKKEQILIYTLMSIALLPLNLLLFGKYGHNTGTYLDSYFRKKRNHISRSILWKLKTIFNAIVLSASQRESACDTCTDESTFDCSWQGGPETLVCH